MMFSCEQVIQGIWAYLDHDLNKTDLEHMQVHLELCRACFSRCEFERLLRESMQRKTNSCCPEQVKARIKSIFEQF